MSQLEGTDTKKNTKDTNPRENDFLWLCFHLGTAGMQGIDVARGKDVNWVSVKKKNPTTAEFGENFRKQVKYNHEMFNHLYPVYPLQLAQMSHRESEDYEKQRDVYDAWDDVNGMDLGQGGPFRHIVLIHDEKGKYQGHIYLFFNPKETEVNAYCIGIRGRTDKFVNPGPRKVGPAMLSAALKHAKDAGKKQLVIIYPRYNMRPILERDGFKKVKHWNLAHLQAKIIPRFVELHGQDAENYVSYVKEINTPQGKDELH